MLESYTCEKCETSFSSRNECLRHEAECGKTINLVCPKCGKEHTYNTKDNDAWIIENEWHEINLGRIGYGSLMDGSDINFRICDKCFYDFIVSFVDSDSVLNTGSNYYAYDGGDI